MAKYFLTENDRRRLKRLLNSHKGGGGERRRRGKISKGGTGTSGSSLQGKLVLLDQDIPAAVAKEPENSVLLPEDVELTEYETATVILQDPIPTDETSDEPNYISNHVDKLPLWGFRSQKLMLKYYKDDETSDEGTAAAGTSTTITLNGTSSIEDDYYNEQTITITGGTGEGQSRTVTDYVGLTAVATVNADWDVTPDNTSEYRITLPLECLLATTVIDVPGDEYEDPLKVVRYALTPVYSMQTTAFEREEYTLSDYPDYPESEEFPPDGTGTFEEPPEGFLKKRYLAQTKPIGNRQWLDLRDCRELPAPQFTEAGS